MADGMTTLGPASFAHVRGHLAEGRTAWFVLTELDDFRLGEYPSRENAAVGWMLAEAVIAARIAGGDW